MPINVSATSETPNTWRIGYSLFMVILSDNLTHPAVHDPQPNIEAGNTGSDATFFTSGAQAVG
jgi:hypothetical protein